MPDRHGTLMLTFGSLFAGIGGFDLGFERAGMQCEWQVEIDTYCRQVLAKHWPKVRRHDDVRTFPPGNPDEWRVDVICGGFPCQDISALNCKAEGIDGPRSRLWQEFARILRMVRPTVAAIENVPAITFRGLDSILYDLAKMRFDAEWQTIPAAAFGAPFEGSRIFILATSDRLRLKENGIFGSEPPKTAAEKQEKRLRFWPGEWKPSAALPSRLRWCPNSELCRVVDGVPDRLDRYRALGNAVVPRVSEWIGRRIVEAMECKD